MPGNSINSVFSTLLSALFPRYCLSCQIEGKILCDRCRANWNGSDFPLDYKAPIGGALLRAWKYSGDLQAGEILLNNLRHHFRVDPFYREIESIVPLPLSALKHRERGFNQAEEVAKVISVLIDRPLISSLIRTKSSTNQADKNRAERLIAYANNPFKVVGKSSGVVLLIDDVKTTGSTLEAATLALKTSGVTKVIPWTMFID